MNIPTKRFGRTEVQMPVLTCGGMRYQQSWDDLDADKIDKANQENLEACIHRALELGINHIETARGYGTSEMQLGRLLPKLERDRFMLQTKIGVKSSAKEMLDTFEVSIRHLKLEYVDFLSIHGINLPEHLEICLKKGGCLDALRQLQREGRVRHVGFSTHAGPEVVIPALETGEFDYVNLHWYYIYDALHRSMVDAAQKVDAGVLIISPNDKGGMLYRPPEKLAKLCEPLSPMQWNALYCLAHPAVNTLSIGAAQPSDFDAHVEAVTSRWNEREQLVPEITARVDAAMEQALGAEWMQNWSVGLPHYDDTPGHINVREIIRLWTFYKGLDLLEFAQMRYNLLGNAEHWFPGEQAPDVRKHDWSCLSASPFADRIPEILKEAHALFHLDKEAKRLSES